MNMATIGTLSSRYAKALYGYAQDNNEEDKVYNDMKYLLYELIAVPETKKFLHNPILPFDTKAKILATAAGGNISYCTKHFFEFIYKKEKQDLLLYISTAFLSVYRKAKNVVFVNLVSAIDPERVVTDEIKEYIAKTYSNTNIEMEITINPEIIGGFILNVDGKQLDLSVKGELENLRKTILKNL